MTTRVRQLFTCQLQNVTSNSQESEKHNRIKERLAVQSILFELEKLHTLDFHEGKLHCRGSVKTKPFGLRRRVFQLGGWISGLSLVSLCKNPRKYWAWIQPFYSQIVHSRLYSTIAELAMLEECYISLIGPFVCSYSLYLLQNLQQ